MTYWMSNLKVRKPDVSGLPRAGKECWGLWEPKCGNALPVGPTAGKPADGNRPILMGGHEWEYGKPLELFWLYKSR